MIGKPSLTHLTTFQRLAGLCDSLTGLLLLVVPVWTLRLLGIHQTQSTPTMVSLVGAFVTGVGIAYLIASRRPRQPAHLIQMQTIWLVTGISRALVAGLLVWKMLSGHLEMGWATVAATDGVLASAQFFGLQQQWLSLDRLEGV